MIDKNFLYFLELRIIINDSSAKKKSDLLKSTTLLKDRCNFISVKAKRIGSMGMINYDMRYVPHSGLSQKVDLSISETLLDCIINNVIVNWYNRSGIPRNGLRLKEVSTT